MNFNFRVIFFILSLCLFNCGQSFASEKSEKIEKQVVLTENQKPIESKTQPELNEQQINNLMEKFTVYKTPTVGQAIFAYISIFVMAIAGSYVALFIHDAGIKK